MVAVDHGAVALLGDSIQTSTEVCYGACAVFVSCTQFINGIQDNGSAAGLPRSAYDCRYELVKRNGISTKIPHGDVLNVPRRDTKRFIYVLHPVVKAGPVYFQVDVQRLTLGTGEATHPGPSLCDTDTQLDEGKTLACLAGPGQQHLVALAENTVDQLAPELRQMAKVICGADYIREIVVLRFQHKPRHVIRSAYYHV